MTPKRLFLLNFIFAFLMIGLLLAVSSMGGCHG